MSIIINITGNEQTIDLNKQYSLNDILNLFPIYGTIYTSIDDILQESKDKDVDLIRDNLVLLYSHQYMEKYKIENRMNNVLDFIKYNPNKLDKTKTYFIGRYGIIELRMIENYLKYGTSYVTKINDIFSEYNINKLKYYENQYTPSDWIGYNNPEYALIKICTNAGFYCTSTNYIDNEYILKEFCEFYLSGLRNMTYISRCNQCKLWYLYINKFCEHKDEIIMNQDTIFDVSDNKNICFISYFADSIKKLYDNGNIFKLYKTRNFTFNKLYTIKSFITTYGNYPHSNWLETYNILCNQIDDLIKNEKVDLFIINAGCYGIPLANHVFMKHNISVIHDGHYLNGFFGIISKKHHLDLNNINIENFIEATQDSYKGIKGLEYWDNEGYWK